MSQLSKIYTFLDQENNYSLHYFDAAASLKELDKIHNIGPKARPFYQKAILSALQLTQFLKPQESLSLAIDSEKPFFKFKIEMSHSASFRTLLLPEEFSDFPNTFTGDCRLTKSIRGQSPYTSHLHCDDYPVENIINYIMTQSYQGNNEIIVSKELDSSIMFSKLPNKNIDKEEAIETPTLSDYQEIRKPFIQTIFNFNASENELLEYFTENNFLYLGSKEVHHSCPCSKDNMINNILLLDEATIQDLFIEDNTIEVRCDYCNTFYNIEKGEAIKKIQ